MIRILQFVHSMDAGGIETFIMNIYRNIDRTKVQFDFLVNTEKECFYDKEIIMLGGKIYRIKTPYNPIFTRKFNKELYLFFVKHPEYKIIHCHRNTTSVYALKQAQKAGIKTRIAHSHIADVKLSLASIFFEWHKLFIKRYATDLFACSKAAGIWLYGKKAEIENKIKIVPNGIDIKRFRYSLSNRIAIRKEFNISNEILIGNIGRLTIQKNQEFLIDAFHSALKLNENMKLLIVGNGKLADKLKNKCKYLGILDKVIFSEVRSDVEKIYSALDVFVFPSLYEGLGIVLIEAQVSGLPVICSNKVPIEAKISNDMYEIKSLDDGKEAWGRCIAEMKINEKRENTYLKYLNGKYSISKVANKLTEFYLSR